ncbi:receptor expression-enhancing protein 2 [Bimuria novae-zelandiae CBS 107.79]|uniref:Protein YOP1 n=1 Tax=Bimuria novae-zelandiae CBS 107.79 TaxID=1447943 RepID=A0A6A5VLZ5_9PLEO|nr:receptor expression-enhancing protein 2 [Bimuria novae-zelandiae CBS 107.79]
MFGFIADGLTVAITVLLPVFASYKALHTSDPAQLAPWLIYFITLALFTTVENTLDFILSWVPFWSWIRLTIHLFLILPGSQGATFLYQEYIEPFLYHHEREIDDFITRTHDSAKKAGFAYFQQAVEWAKVNVLGFAPQQRPPSPVAGQSYAQNFMSRFNMPAARGSDNLYGLVNQALSGASALYSGNRDAQATELSRNANIIPENIRNNDDRLSYVSSQRERLMTLLQAFDREAENVRAQRESGSRYHEGGGGLAHSRSEAEFDRIDRVEVDDASSSSERPPYPITPPPLDRRTSSGWMPWNWQRGAPQPEDPLAYGREPGARRDQARSTGFDLGDR